MKKAILLSFLYCMLSSMISAQAWVEFTKSTPESPVINLTRSDNLQVDFNLEVCGMYKQALTEGNETFQRVSIPSWSVLTETGQPELPFIRQLIAIPECDDISLSVNITGQTSFSYYNIYPAPEYVEAEDDNDGIYLEEVFTKDEQTYALNQFLPGMNAEIISTGYLRGQKYAEVYFYPVQFNPVTNQINVYTNFQVTLSFTNPGATVNANTGIFNNIAANAFLNYASSGIKATVNDNVESVGNVQWIELTDTAQACTISADYLVICADVFFDPADPDSEVLKIANHRATYNGFDVAILNAETIISDGLGFFYEGLNIVPPDPTYKKEQRIRTCIRRVYEGANAQHTYDGKLGYVLLIGDTYPPGGNQGMPMSLDHGHLAPPSYSEPFPTDYYFSCVTKQENIYDETGDLFIGRFCVDNNLDEGLIELHNVVEKTIFYESEATFGGWRDETGVLVHEEFTNYMPHFFDFVENLVPSYFTVDEIDATQPNTHETIYQVINDGTMLFTYYGHGNTNGWSAGGYLDVSVFKNNLINTNKAPVVHAVACETGHFDNWGDCIGESMVTYSDVKGFTGYIGASRSVHANPAWWENGLVSDPPDRFQEIL